MQYIIICLIDESQIATPIRRYLDRIRADLVSLIRLGVLRFRIVGN